MQPFPSPVYRAVQATYAPVPTMQHRPPLAHEQVPSASSRPPVPTLKPATLKPAPHEKLKLMKPAPAPGQDATQVVTRLLSCEKRYHDARFDARDG